jgi:alpha-L-fucosidase
VVSDHHPPEWWRDAKFGVMITWGPYSVPAFAEPTDSFFAFAEWYWLYQQLRSGELAEAFPAAKDDLHREYHRRTYGERLTYDDFLDRWHAQAWSPREWINLFERAGARYFVLVAKHHDGVALWPTSTSDRHTGGFGPKRDIVGELMTAAENSTLHTGLFYALAEWFNPAPRPARLADPDEPLFDLAFNRSRRARNAYTDEPMAYRGYRKIDDYAADHVIPQMRELVDRYQPEIFWADLPGDPEYYRSHEFLSYIYKNAAHEVAVNDRTGIGVAGDFHTYEVGHRPAVTDGSVPFEACRSIGTSFGYNAMETPEQYASPAELVWALVDVVAHGGNFLLNVGPRADGTIPAAQAERLRAIGDWLEVNGEAIYGSRPWHEPTADGVAFTVGSNDGLYAITAQRQVRIPVAARAIELLGRHDPPPHRLFADHVEVEMPESELPSVLRLTRR